MTRRRIAIPDPDERARLRKEAAPQFQVNQLVAVDAKRYLVTGLDLKDGWLYVREVHLSTPHDFSRSTWRMISANLVEPLGLTAPEWQGELVPGAFVVAPTGLQPPAPSFVVGQVEAVEGRTVLVWFADGVGHQLHAAPVPVHLVSVYADAAAGEAAMERDKARFAATATDWWLHGDRQIAEPALAAFQARFAQDRAKAPQAVQGELDIAGQPGKEGGGHARRHA